MQAHEDLLNEAGPFCNPSTGEVVQRLPDELMRRLRDANLARGIPRQRSGNTQTYATWFVFFTDEIKERVMREFRQANQKRKRKSKSKAGAESGDRPDAEGSPSPDESPAPQAQSGLAQFRRIRQMRK
jgi:hypothetical protein